MLRFAADNMKAERDGYIRAAVKANRPWPDIVADFGITLEEVMTIAGEIHGSPQKKGSSAIWKPGDPPDERR